MKKLPSTSWERNTVQRTFLQNHERMNHESFSKLCRCLVLLLSIVHDKVLLYRMENKLFYSILFLFTFKVKCLTALSLRPAQLPSSTQLTKPNPMYTKPNPMFTKPNTMFSKPNQCSPNQTQCSPNQTPFCLSKQYLHSQLFFTSVSRSNCLVLTEYTKRRVLSTVGNALKGLC